MDTSQFYHAFSDGFVYDIPKDASTITNADQAEAYCASKGGVLASVDTEAKKEAIKEAAMSGPITEPLLFGTYLYVTVLYLPYPIYNCVSKV